jgi:hypothetical protein
MALFKSYQKAWENMLWQLYLNTSKMMLKGPALFGNCLDGK